MVDLETIEKEHSRILSKTHVGVGPGWYQIIYDLCNGLQKLTDEIGHPQVEAVQIKEKFGELRFYVDGGSDEQHNLIRAAENLSHQTCDVCGKPGKRGGKGWIATRCEEHKL